MHETMVTLDIESPSSSRQRIPALKGEGPRKKSIMTETLERPKERSHSASHSTPPPQTKRSDGVQRRVFGVVVVLVVIHLIQCVSVMRRGDTYTALDFLHEDTGAADISSRSRELELLEEEEDSSSLDLEPSGFTEGGLWHIPDDKREGLHIHQAAEFFKDFRDELIGVELFQDFQVVIRDVGEKDDEKNKPAEATKKTMGKKNTQKSPEERWAGKDAVTKKKSNSSKKKGGKKSQVSTIVRDGGGVPGAAGGGGQLGKKGDGGGGGGGPKSTTKGGGGGGPKSTTKGGGGGGGGKLGGGKSVGPRKGGKGGKAAAAPAARASAPRPAVNGLGLPVTVWPRGGAAAGRVDAGDCISRNSQECHLMPSFFLIGAPGSGVRAVRALLAGHPRLVPSAPGAAAGLFAQQARAPKSAKQTVDYLSMLPSTPVKDIGEKASFEAREDFLYVNKEGKRIPEMLKALLPRARLVVLVREPALRAYAVFQEACAAGSIGYVEGELEYCPEVDGGCDNHIKTRSCDSAAFHGFLFGGGRRRGGPPPPPEDEAKAGAAAAAATLPGVLEDFRGGFRRRLLEGSKYAYSLKNWLKEFSPSSIFVADYDNIMAMDDTSVKEVKRLLAFFGQKTDSDGPVQSLLSSLRTYLATSGDIASSRPLHDMTRKLVNDYLCSDNYKLKIMLKRLPDFEQMERPNYNCMRW